MPENAPTTPPGGEASAAPIPTTPNPRPTAPRTTTTTTIHNPAGNTTLRRPDPTSNPDHPKRTDDAWNRLVKIENDPTGDDLAVHAYARVINVLIPNATNLSCNACHAKGLA